MDLKTLVATINKIETLDKPILIYLHLIINNLDKKSNELNFYQNQFYECGDNKTSNDFLNIIYQKESQNSFFNFAQNELIFSLLKTLQKYVCMKH